MPPPPAVIQPAGWYDDPWNAAAWRWWDGHQWTANVHGESTGPGATGTAVVARKKPRLPSWLSVPVVGAAVPGVPLIGYTLFLSPLGTALGLVPLLIVVPVLLWIDRVEPEPWMSRLHALLWGGFVAGLLGLTTNTVVALASNESWAAVVSAPLSEEIGKTLGILWAVRRKEVDGVMDGLVYAGWVALGFAVIEDFSYFGIADQDDMLLQVFLLRAIFTPFAHPLFTAWAGLAIGLAVSRRKSLWWAWWGLALSILTHAAWNGSLVAAAPTDDDAAGNPFIILGVMVFFFALFVSTVAAIIWLRRRDQRRFTELVPFVAMRYALPYSDVAIFGNRSQMLATRKQLPKPDRKRFDRRHAAIARLAALHDHPGDPDPADESRLMAQLRDAG